jgi:uncharacterized membrane protein
MKNRSPWSILVAEMSYFLTVMLALIAGYVFWKGNVLSKVDKGSEYGAYQVLPFLGLIEIAMVVVFLFTLRRILVKTGILTKEESFKYLRSRSWYMDH